MVSSPDNNTMRLALIVLPLALLAGCKQDTFRPVVYPNASDLSVYHKGPEFSSLEDARAWVRERTASWSGRNWDYEIGKNWVSVRSSTTGPDVSMLDESLDLQKSFTAARDRRAVSWF